MSQGSKVTALKFLQEQNAAITRELEEMESKRDNLYNEVAEWQEKEKQLIEDQEHVDEKIKEVARSLEQDDFLCIKKQQNVAALKDKSENLLALVEELEGGMRKDKESSIALKQQSAHLRPKEENIQRVRDETESKVTAYRAEHVKVNEQLRSKRNLIMHKRSEIAEVESTSKVETEALKDTIRVNQRRSVEYNGSIDKQKSSMRQLETEAANLKNQLQDLQIERAKLKSQLDGDDQERAKFERSKGSIQTQIDHLSAEKEALRKTFEATDNDNKQLQENQRMTAAKFREAADKVYTLMDTLRVQQVAQKKQEAENMTLDKKINTVARTIANLNTKISSETEKKEFAKQECENAEKNAHDYRRKSKSIEDQIANCQKEMETQQKACLEMADKVAKLSRENNELNNKIASLEEQKTSYKAELDQVNARISEADAGNKTVTTELDQQQATLTVAKEQYQKLKAELEHMKREDLLDEAGRKRPILIQANESALLERLQINEFLYESQQQKNPVPRLVEKMAELLELVHRAQSQSDQYLADLSKSNGLAIALRKKNIGLFESVSMFEAFKTKALMQYIRNFFEDGDCSNLVLDGLYVDQKEIQDMLVLAEEYQALENVKSVRLSDCGLLDEHSMTLINILFKLPYIKELDLSRNCLTTDTVEKFVQQCNTMEGVTQVIKDLRNIITVHSGNQLRLKVDLSDQSRPDERVNNPLEGMVEDGMNMKDADPFFDTSAGKVYNGQGVQKSQASFGEITAVPGGYGGGAPSQAGATGSVPVGLGGPGDALKQKQGGAKAGAAGKIRKPAAGGDNASVRSSRSGGSSTRNRGRK